MNFIFSEQQAQLQEIARRFCAEHSDSARVRAAMASESGFDASVWARLVGELGWGGIAVPESHGGLGLGQLEIAIVQQEMGRRLLASPFLASIGLAIPALLAAGSETQRAHFVPALAGGERIAAFACTGERGKPGAPGVEALLTPGADGRFRLSGSASFVVFGHVADLFIIAARRPGSSGDDGISLLALPRDTPGLAVEKLRMLDLSRPCARLSFDAVDVPAEAVLGEPEQAAAALRRTLAIGAIAIAAEQVGGAERCLEFTVEYAKQREQFGRPIGSFQAVKHKLADMMVLVEAAKSAVYYAACAADEDDAQLQEAAAVAKSFCSDAFSRCAGAAIQLHGGIGITWEHDAHLYFKRARASSNLLGDVRHQREQIARGLFDADQPLLRQLGGQ
jgi:alkylation response protein AidB-like acyl-CoA dehydrogenase